MSQPSERAGAGVEFQLGQLRHLYHMLMRSQIQHQPSAARGLLGPAIETMERLQAVADAARELFPSTAGAWDSPRFARLRRAIDSAYALDSRGEK